MPAICHAEACRVMLLFIGVPLQTHFITPCAREFFGRVCCIWVSPLSVVHFLSRPCALASPCYLHPPLPCLGSRPSPLSPAGGGGCAASWTSSTRSVSWGPLWTAASLATRTCHSARYGSFSSIPTSGGGSGSHGRHGSYCSLVLKELSLLFI